MRFFDPFADHRPHTVNLMHLDYSDFDFQGRERARCEAMRNASFSVDVFEILARQKAEMDELKRRHARELDALRKQS